MEPSVPRELFPLPAVDIGWSPYDATSERPALPPMVLGYAGAVR